MTGNDRTIAGGCIYVIGLLAILLALGVIAWWLVTTFVGIIHHVASAVAVAA